MDAIAVFVIFWVMFSMVAAEVGPWLLEVTGLAIRFAFIVLREALRGVWWLAAWFVRAAAAGGLFLYILADEWRLGPREEKKPEEEEPEEEEFDAEEWWAEWQERLRQEREPPAPPDPYEEAIALLGLPPGFSRSALHRAWKDKIRKAHPDAGGSSKQAQAINAARDLIAKRNGWK
jgi:hypothetical protein